MALQEKAGERTGPLELGGSSCKSSAREDREKIQKRTKMTRADERLKVESEEGGVRE